MVINLANSAKRKAGICIVAAIFILGLLYLLVISINRGKNIDNTLLNNIHSDIVLINIQEGDRAFIGEAIKIIDSCNPALIGVDAWFVDEKEKVSDSILCEALKSSRKDVLAYTIDTGGQIVKSNIKFSRLASTEGLAVFAENIKNRSISMIPVQKIDTSIHEQFALKILQNWKPSFRHAFKVNQLIPIEFTHSLENFVHLNASDLFSKNYCEQLRNKVVLLGYLGPKNIDKHFTPFGLEKKEYLNQPDTYGIVVIANAIQTILKYKESPNNKIEIIEKVKQ